ncbi:175_t:CDS:2, partial [Racocetra persica]
LTDKEKLEIAPDGKTLCVNFEKEEALRALEEPNKDPHLKPNELCEKCGSSCIVHKTKTSYTIKRRRYIKHKQENQGTCPQCHKTEFPDMAKGRMLDYERLTQVEMMPPELDHAKSLEQRLNNQNLTPQERQQADYLRNLQRNTLRNAENNYQTRYGDLTEDDPNKGKGLSGGIIALIVIGIAIIVGGIIFLLTRRDEESDKGKENKKVIAEENNKLEKWLLSNSCCGQEMVLEETCEEDNNQKINSRNFLNGSIAIFIERRRILKEQFQKLKDEFLTEEQSSIVELRELPDHY